MNKILLIALLLVGCDVKEHEDRRNEIWDKAEMLDVKYYKSNTDPRYIQTFEMDGYKFVIYTNGRGSAITTIPLTK